MRKLHVAPRPAQNRASDSLPGDLDVPARSTLSLEPDTRFPGRARLRLNRPHPRGQLAMHKRVVHRAVPTKLQ
jgi:hypothetical protein